LRGVFCGMVDAGKCFGTVPGFCSGPEATEQGEEVGGKLGRLLRVAGNLCHVAVGAFGRVLWSQKKSRFPGLKSVCADACMLLRKFQQLFVAVGHASFSLTR